MLVVSVFEFLIHWRNVDCRWLRYTIDTLDDPIDDFFAQTWVAIEMQTLQRLWFLQAGDQVLYRHFYETTVAQIQVQQIRVVLDELN